MARRTGREGIYTRVVTKDLDEAERKLSAKEIAEVLKYFPLSDEQKANIQANERLEEDLRQLV